MKPLTTLAAEVDQIRETLFGIARAHRSVIPPAEVVATEAATLAQQLGEVISALLAPAGLLSSVEWTADLADAEVATLDDQSRRLLANALREAWNDKQDWAVLDKVRGRIAGKYPFADARVVLFTASEWDNGWYLDDTAAVFFADGTSDSNVDFGCTTELTEGHGSVGPDSALAVNLRTGEMFFDDYRANVTEKMCEWLGLAELPPSA